MTNKTEDIYNELLNAQKKYLGKIYKHYKGGIYKVVGVYFDSTTDQPALLYQRIEGMHFDMMAESDIKFGRTVSEFEELVGLKDDIKVPRFVRVIQETVWKPI